MADLSASPTTATGDTGNAVGDPDHATAAAVAAGLGVASSLAAEPGSGKDGHEAGGGGADDDSKTARGDDDDDDEGTGGGSGRERRKIEIRFIQDKSRRHITFSKRKAGIMKKAYELSVLTGTQVLLLVVSETGLVYTFTTPKLQPLVTKAEGKNLIQACLNAPEPIAASGGDSEEDLSRGPGHGGSMEPGAYPMPHDPNGGAYYGHNYPPGYGHTA